MCIVSSCRQEEHLRELDEELEDKEVEESSVMAHPSG